MVKHGWERVLRARLEDARFFWHQDLREKLDTWLEKLEHVIFIARLGSMADKTRRLESLCRWLAETAAAGRVDAGDAARRERSKYARVGTVGAPGGVPLL